MEVRMVLFLLASLAAAAPCGVRDVNGKAAGNAEVWVVSSEEAQADEHRKAQASMRPPVAVSGHIKLKWARVVGYDGSFQHQEIVITDASGAELFRARPESAAPDARLNALARIPSNPDVSTGWFDATVTYAPVVAEGHSIHMIDTLLGWRCTWTMSRAGKLKLQK